MRFLSAVFVFALATVWAAAGSSQVLNGVSFEATPGEVFTFIGGSGGGKTTIALADGYVVVGDGDDRIIADLGRRDIYANGPGGALMSMRTMAEQFTGGGVAASGGSGTTGDLDAEFEALFEGMPPTMKSALRAQLETLPRDQAMVALQVLRGQMNLPPVDPDALAGNPKPTKSVEFTGNTQSLNGRVLYEYIAAGDRIWAVDAAEMTGGARLVEGMSALGEIYNDIAAGLPTDDSSFFRIGELDGRAPYHIVTQDGESFTYESTTKGDVRVPKF